MQQLEAVGRMSFWRKIPIPVDFRSHGIFEKVLNPNAENPQNKRIEKKNPNL